MNTPNRAQSPLLLRLALAVADSKYPVATLRRRMHEVASMEGRADEPRATEPREHGTSAIDFNKQGESPPIPESAWQRLESLRLRFESELSFADSCLAEDPPNSRIAMLLANSSELRKVAILQRCVDRACSYRFHHVREGLEIADDLITWTTGDPSALVAVIRGRALMERGNFLRLLGDPAGASASFAEASKQLDAHSTGDPLELARYETLLGVFERDRGNIEAAVHLLRKALAKVRRWGDLYTLQTVLNTAGITELYNDNFEQAEMLFDEAMRIEEPDSLLLRMAAFNRLFAYLLRGNPHKAYQALLRVHCSLGTSWLEGIPEPGRMKVLWAEGLILNALNIDYDAIGLLKKARELAIGSGLGSEVCHISIELALNYASQGRFSDVRRELTFGLPFCSERRTLDNYTKEVVLLLLGTLQHRGRLEEEQLRAAAFRLDRIYRAPLQPLRKPVFADLPL